MKLFIAIVLLSALPLFSQTADSTVAEGQGPGSIVEAGQSIIKIQIEKPQVQMLSNRIKPKFQEVNLEKTFLDEILDKGQSISIDYKVEGIDDRIDIDALLKRKR